MTPELTQDYDERTSLNSYRFTFSIGGSILSLILTQIVFSQISDRQQQYIVLAGSLYCNFDFRIILVRFWSPRSHLGF